MLHFTTSLRHSGYLALLASIILLYSSCGDETYVSIPQNACDLPYNELSISCDPYNVEFSGLGQGWATFVGDGEQLRVSAFSFGNFMDLLRLYEGDDCNNLTLIATSNQNESKIEFQSVAGKRYFVEMIDDFGYECTIFICNDEYVPNNDLCIDAIEWLPNTRLLGSTKHATNTALPPTCLENNGKGVWYSLQGDGQPYNFNLMKSELGGFGNNLGTEEFHFNIYEGDCSNLVCVLGQTSLGPVTFTPSIGTTYYIYVTIRPDADNPDAYDDFIFAKSTCVDLIDGITIESCPGSNQSKVKVTATQPNVTFGYVSIVDFFGDGFEYAFIAGNSNNGPLTNTNGKFTITAPKKGYIAAFVGDDLRSALCWDYVYFDITGNEPDLTSPTANCKNHTLELDQQGMATLEANMIDGGSFDNCTITSEVLSETNFDCDDIGNHTVTLMIEDAAGLSASCTSIVTVVDNLLPTPQCNNISVTLDEDGIKNLLVDQIDNGSSDNCSVQHLELSPPIVDCDDAMVGGGTVQLIVTDNSGNTNSCTAVITVIDDTPPMAHCMNATVTLDNNGEGLLNPSDIDNNSFDACGISRLSIDANVYDCEDIGQTNTVELTVTDNNHNTSMCTATVTVVDDTPPTAVCKTTTVEIQPNGQYALELSDIYDDANSSDNCAITGVNFTPITFTCDELDQSFQIPVMVTDASGNSSTCTASVSVVLGTDLPDGWNTSDIGQVTLGNAYSFDPCANSNPANGEFTIVGSGNNGVGTTSDNVAFAYQSLCGDKMITAKIENVEPNGYGGLMIRESSASGAKQVAIFSDMTNLLRHEYRSTTNGPKIVGSFFKPNPFWLRLQRQGDWIFAYYSTTGTNFTYVHGVYVPMQSCIEIGLASFTFLPNSQNATVFSNVSITNSNGTLAEEETPTPETKPLSDVPIAIGIGEVGSPETFNLIPGTFSVYPNPNNGKFTVQFDQVFEQEVELVLFNPFGQEIERKVIAPQTRNVEWNISRVSAGVYFIKLNGEGIKAQVKEFTVTH